MRPHLIVLLAPSFDQDLGLLQRVEDLVIQELVAELADQRLDRIEAAEEIGAELQFLLRYADPDHPIVVGLEQLPPSEPAEHT